MDLLIYNYTFQTKVDRYRFFNNLEETRIDWGKIDLYNRIMDQIGEDIQANFETQMREQKNLNNILLVFKFITKYCNDIINFGLHWEETPEGHEYWSNICSKYRRMYNQLRHNENN